MLISAGDPAVRDGLAVQQVESPLCTWTGPDWDPPLNFLRNLKIGLRELRGPRAPLGGTNMKICKCCDNTQSLLWPKLFHSNKVLTTSDNVLEGRLELSKFRQN